MPVNLNPNSRETRQTDNSRLHLLAEQLRKELQRANLVQEPEISEDENNLSLNAELDFAQGDFDRGYQIRNGKYMPLIFEYKNARNISLEICNYFCNFQLISTKFSDMLFFP
jgi:hypothetical protein